MVTGERVAVGGVESNEFDAAWRTAYYSFPAWVPNYLIRSGFPIVGTLAFAFVMLLGAIPGNSLVGYLADRVGRKWANVVLYLALGIIGIASI